VTLAASLSHSEDRLVVAWVRPMVATLALNSAVAAWVTPAILAHLSDAVAAWVKVPLATQAVLA